MPDENEETRIERNERFSMSDKTPEPPVIEGYAETLLGRFWDLRDSIQRTMQGIAVRLSPADFHYWQKLSGEHIDPSDYTVLKAMDSAYCIALNRELEAFRERQRDASDQGDD